MPGFIFLKVSSMLIASENNDFSKKWYDAVAYGIIFSGITYVILLIPKNYILNYFIFVLGTIIFPIIMPFAIKWLRNKPFLKNRILRPEVTSWDYIFSSRKPFWIILHLKNGNNIGGVYAYNSFTSSYPYKQDIYIEELWQLDENSHFDKKIEKSAGIWIATDEISSIEFFEYEEDESNE